MLPIAERVARTLGLSKSGVETNEIPGSRKPPTTIAERLLTSPNLKPGSPCHSKHLNAHTWRTICIVGL